jgi:hypothetical protein
MEETIVATAMPHKRHIRAIQSGCPSRKSVGRITEGKLPPGASQACPTDQTAVAVAIRAALFQPVTKKVPVTAAV